MAYFAAIDARSAAGETGEPAVCEVHHQLFLIRRSAGQPAPSPDAMAVMLRALR